MRVLSSSILRARGRESARAGATRAPLVLASLFAVMLLGELNVHLMSPLLPAIASDLSVAVGTAGALVSAYSFAAAASALLVGPLSDVWGRLPFLRLALGVLAVSFSLTAVVTNFPALLVLRALSGLAAGAVSTTVTTYVGDYFPYARRGRAFTVITTASSVALGVGVPAGAMLASAAGWRSVFSALLAATLVVVPVALFLPHPPSKPLRLGVDVAAHVKPRNSRQSSSETRFAAARINNLASFCMKRGGS
ncbi:MAG: MFS transporter [Luteitalea sp.]|nr:MFS transporter [Luteitalea sp.]